LAKDVTGEAESGPLRLEFDRSVKVEFRGSAISSDGGLLLHRELDDALGLTDMAAGLLSDMRTGRNGRHRIAGFLRQSVFPRLAGYEDVNDADRLCGVPVMRQLVGGRAVKDGAASASAMGRFETEMLTSRENFAALTELSGRWIDAVHDRRPPKVITLDMDSSVSPVHGDQEGARWNGHFQSKCLHPLFVFNQFGDPLPDSACLHARKEGAVRPASRQRAQRRWLGRCAATGAGAVRSQGPSLDHPAAVPGRCRLRHSSTV